MICLDLHQDHVSEIFQNTCQATVPMPVQSKFYGLTLMKADGIIVTDSLMTAEGGSKP
jgi:hypothetical protein